MTDVVPTPLARRAPEAIDTVPAIRQILVDSEQADHVSPVSDQALLAARHGRRELFTVEGAGGSPVGIVILGEGELDLVIAPAERGNGAGTAALTAILSYHAQQSYRAQQAEPSGELRAWAHGENPAATALLTRADFAPVRALYRLALPVTELSNAIDEARPLEPGFALRDFDPAEPREAEEWVRVNAAAFASHPEQGAVTLADFRSLTQEPWFDAHDLRLAWSEESGELAGYTWIKTVRSTEAEGAGEPVIETELYVLGVHPRFAGHGLGAALLGDTLRRMHDHQPDRITLYVDGDNERARALYHRAGFVVDQLSTQWLRTDGHSVHSA